MINFRHEICLKPISNKTIGTHSEICSILRYKPIQFCRSSQGSARICYLRPDSVTEFILFTGRLSETEICFLTEFQELCRSKDITRTFLVASDRHVVVSVRADTPIWNVMSLDSGPNKRFMCSAFRRHFRLRIIRISHSTGQ